MTDHFISEDAIVNWVKSAGGVLHTRKFTNIETVELSDKKLVCLTGYDHILQLFFTRIINNFNSPVVLITIETDFFNMKKEYVEHPKIKHWFTWNQPYPHPKVTCLPIGLNYDRHVPSLQTWFKKKRRRYKKRGKPVPKVFGNHNKTLLINFSPHTNATRRDLVEKGKTVWSKFCNVIDKFPDPSVRWQKSYVDGSIRVSVTNPDFYNILANYKFIVSPPGAGLDCHRTWEALYVGTIPIVLSSAIDSTYENLPVVVVNDWDEVTEEFLKEKYAEYRSTDHNTNSMYLDYWIDKIKNEIA